MMWSTEWAPPRALVEGRLSQAAQRSLRRQERSNSEGEMVRRKGETNQDGQIAQ